jgi:hypothetical protein
MSKISKLALDAVLRILNLMEALPPRTGFGKIKNSEMGIVYN